MIMTDDRGAAAAGAAAAGAAAAGAAAAGAAVLTADPHGEDRADGRSSTPRHGEGGQADPPPSECAETFDYAYSRRIACLADPAGSAAGSYRALQTHLLAAHVRDGRRGLVMCAPHREAGCTTVAVNLAVACAQAGINTLLVDANLHRPAVHEFIRPATATTGLAQMLGSDPERYVDDIRRDVRPNLSLLYAGDAPSRAPDLIASRRFKQIIDACMRAYEFTIVDTPALCDSSDARQIAMSVRYGMMIARRNVTRLADVRQAIASLSSDRVRLVGSFLADF